MHRKYSGENHRGGSKNLRKYVSAACKRAYVIHHPSHYTSNGIYVLSENQRYLIDEYVPEHTSRGTGDCSHYDVEPERITFRKASLDPHNGEKTDSDRVEDEEGVVQTDKVLPEYDDEKKGYRRDYGI